MILKRYLILLLTMGVVLAGCGSGTDPYKIFSATPGTPTIGLPVDIAVVTTATTLNVSNRLDLTLNGGIGTANVVAPIHGIITAIEGVTPTYAITIFYNQNFSVQLSNITAVGAIRVGDQITRGQVIGTMNTTYLNPLAISVINNGVAACPVFFLDDVTARNSIVAKLGLNICP